jgi:hypothetical protein
LKTPNCAFAADSGNADRQREAVSALECANHDAAIAKRLLILFEKANEIHVADRDRIIKELVD